MSRGFLLLSLALLQFAYQAEAQTPDPSLNPSSPKQQQVLQNEPEVTTLELGKLVARELSGGQRDRYEIVLSAGQYVKIEIKPNGIILGVSLQLPDGVTRQLFQPFESQREMTVGEVAEKSVLRALTRRLGKNSGAGAFSYVGFIHPFGQCRVRQGRLC